MLDKLARTESSRDSKYGSLKQCVLNLTRRELASKVTMTTDRVHIIINHY